MAGSELLFVNLAVVDFMSCICFYPLSIMSSFSHAWLGQGLTCIYYGLGCYTLGLCSMFTVAAISVVRYLKTCCQLVYGESTRCLVTWWRGGGVGGGERGRECLSKASLRICRPMAKPLYVCNHLSF